MASDKQTKKTAITPEGANLPIMATVDEKALLGTLIRFDDLNDKKRADARPALEGMGPAMFADADGGGTHARLAQCIAMLRNEGKEINLDSVLEWLASHGWLQTPAEQRYIQSLTASMYPCEHLKRVKDAYVARFARRESFAFAETVHGYLKFAGENADPAEVAAWVKDIGGDNPELYSFIREYTTKIEDLIGGVETVRGSRPKDRMGARHERIINRNEAIKNGLVADGTRTGMPSVDAVLGNLEPSLIMVAAWQGIGKSSLMRKWALNMAGRTDTKKTGVIIFSMEMPADELIDTLIYTVAQVDGSKLDSGKAFTKEEVARITVAANVISKLHIHIEDEETLPEGVLTPKLMESITRRVMRDFAAEGIETAAVMIDYLQIMELDEKNKNMTAEREIRKLAYDTKRAATRMKVPVIALAQLNEAGKDRGDGRPRAEDMRESKGIVQAAHKVVLIHNPNYNARATQVAGTSGSEPEYVELIVGKNRSGKTGLVEARFLPHTTTFLDMTEIRGVASDPVELPGECAIPAEWYVGANENDPPDAYADGEVPYAA